jgi:hypothetical protein
MTIRVDVPIDTLAAYWFFVAFLFVNYVNKEGNIGRHCVSRVAVTFRLRLSE